MQEIVCINIVPGKLTKLEKVFLLMINFPETRNSYAKLVELYYDKYNDTPSVESIKRCARTIQCDLPIFPASNRTRENRNFIRKRIIEESKKDKGFLGFIRKFFK